MDVIALDLPAPWLVMSWMLAVPVLLYALRVAPWQRLSERPVTRVWHGGIVVATALWSLQATVSGHFTFHLLGMAGLTLALGVPLALVSAAIVVAVHCGIHGAVWQNMASVWLTLCVTAVTTTAIALRLSERYLPPNFFIYLFVVAFFGAGVSLIVAGASALLVLAATTGLSISHAFAQYAPFLMQLGFAEAMSTGMLITIGVVYRPQWVTTFEDARYLKPR